MYRSWPAILALLIVTGVSRAGLYYSGETVAELPSQWRGFLLDQRLLRNLAIKPTAGAPASPARQRYEQEAAKLLKAGRERKLTADELADLGALHIRLGELDQAIEVLRTAQRQYPDHFHTVANLGTAWQLQGDLDQAAVCLQQAVRLAPAGLQKAEEYQLKLVRLRQRQKGDDQSLDDLFGVRYVADDGKYEPGKLAAAQRKHLPAEAVALVQQLALWLPADGRLLWQMAELAGAHGDVKAAAAMMDGCVTQFGLRHPELRRHRQAMRVAADELAKNGNSADTLKAAHEGHAAGLLRPRSSRPLVNQLDQAPLPPVQADGVNPLPWRVLSETTIDRKFKPTFPKYLQELDGKQVSLSGYVQPVGEDPELTSFMLIEYPVGCWYCEMPELAGIVLVELPPQKTVNYTRSQVTVVGTLSLNATNPENFLFTINQAKVSEGD